MYLVIFITLLAFIGNLYIFPLISLTDMFSINRLNSDTENDLSV